MAAVLTDRPTTRHHTALSALERMHGDLTRQHEALHGTMQRDSDRGVSPSAWQYAELESLAAQIDQVDANIEMLTDDEAG